MSPSPPSTTLDPIARISAYGPWLIVSVALRYALTYPWDAAAWAEVRQHIPWLLAEQDRIRKAGWFN
jgi:hypothetical protein